MTDEMRNTLTGNMWVTFNECPPSDFTRKVNMVNNGVYYVCIDDCAYHGCGSTPNDAFQDYLAVLGYWYVFRKPPKDKPEPVTTPENKT